MFKTTLLLVSLFLSINSSVQALNSIDKFIVGHGVSECNGESQNCKDFYTRAVDLNDDRSPISSEIRF